MRGELPIGIWMIISVMIMVVVGIIFFFFVEGGQHFTSAGVGFGLVLFRRDCK